MSVAARPISPARPITVHIAYVLYLAGYLVNLIITVLPPVTPANMTQGLLSTAIGVAIATWMWRGRNWARVTLVVLTALGVLIAVAAIVYLATRIVLSSQTALVLGSALFVSLVLVATIAMYAPASNDFFRTVKAARRSR